MYNLEDLFDRRSSVGARLEQILEDKKCTKAELYKKTGVSRPTIDKILAGTITNKTNYEKHMAKLIKYLEVTPDFLLGNTARGKNKVREIRNLIKLPTDQMAEATGIPVERLRGIEAGDHATCAELRDLAAALHTRTSVLEDNYFFEPQIGELDYFIDTQNSSMADEISGFWGYIGILLEGYKTWKWYPITRNTYKCVSQGINRQQLVVPCMNNKVLFLYMPNVKEIILQDEACEKPYDKGLTDDIDCGKIPLVVYEILSDYGWEAADNENDETSDFLSSRCRSWIQQLVDCKDWDEEDIFSLVELSQIYHADGEIQPVWIDFDCGNEDVSSRIELVYGFNLNDIEERFLSFTDINESTIFLNIERISMLELPLLKVEEAICKNM